MRKKKFYFLLTVFLLINASFLAASGEGFENSNSSDSLVLLSENIKKSDLIFSTYFGGENEDLATSLFADSYGNIFITGNTQSLEFPLKDPMFCEKIGNIDVFIAMLSPSGDILLKSTYFGGNGDDKAESMWIDNSGRIYIVGSTTSTDFPVTENAFQKENSGNWDAFVVCFSEDLDNIIYSTYLGGSLGDSAHDIVVGNDSCAVITGITSSEDFPVTKNTFQRFNRGRRDAYVLKLNSQGSDILSSTYFGGTSDDYGEGIAIDTSKNVYITGYTYSSKTKSLPVKNTLFDPSPYSYDAYCSSFNENLSQLRFSTYIGGESGDRGTDLALNGDGIIFLTGYTYSENFPLQNAWQSNFSGGKYSDAYILSLTNNGDRILFSTFLGGENDDFSYEVKSDLPDRISISGGTSSAGFPVTDELSGFESMGGSMKTDSFLSIFNPKGDLVSSIKFGGSMYDSASCHIVNGPGDIIVTGKTKSDDFNVKNPFYGLLSGNFDLFLTKISMNVSKKDDPVSTMSGYEFIVPFLSAMILLYFLKLKK